MSEPLPLSVIIITLNEAHHIIECIDSVKRIAAEIIVLDAGSEDETLALARARGARAVQTADWPGFGPQKNRALALAQFPWVLSLDADERIPPALSVEITRAVRNACYVAYSIPRRTQFCGKWVRHSGWTPDYVVRLFRRDQGCFSEQSVHERVLVDGKIGYLTQPIDHYSYLSQHEVDGKVQRYARAGAQELYRAGASSDICTALLHSGWAWWRTFVLRLGFLDGPTGWAIAAMNARTAWLKYKHLRALCSGN